MNPIKLPAIVADIIQYGVDTYLVCLKPGKNTPPFKPGQFLHLTIDEYDPAGGFWPESRVFSIASSYGEPMVEIVYSVKGVYTRRMQQELRVGAGVWLKLPYGDFVIDAAQGDSPEVVLVAGGTGISPFLPFLSGLKAGNRATVALYYGVRENGMALKRELLRSLVQSKLLNLSFYVQNEAVLPIEEARNVSGLLDIEAIYSETKMFESALYYISGPPGMISSFRRGLLAFSVPEDRIKIDEWE